MSAPPSITRRLGNALVLWSLVWSAGVAVAVWLAAEHEVDELLDDTLVTSAGVLRSVAAAVPAGVVPAAPGSEGRFVWQVLGADGRLVGRSAEAPEQPFHAAARSGFFDTAQWRVYGVEGDAGRTLYVAQTREERTEAKVEVATAAVVAALAIALIGQLWLRYRLGHELDPLRRLSARVAQYGGDEGLLPALGVAEREELEPMHRALDDLGERLRARIASERAFSAHAAHALRTPLAGIDAQLAVAIQEADATTQPRLRRVRAAADRLQRVVVAMLELFRTGGTLKRSRHELAALLERLPVAGLEVHVEPGATVDADGDLLSAALANLLDNAARQGATRVEVRALADHAVRLQDDGPGVDAARRESLRSLLQKQHYETGSGLGLGLVLADLVARAHGGALSILDAEQGFAVELRLAA